MAGTVLILLSFCGVLVVGLMAVAQRRHLRGGQALTSCRLRVSVLKPLKGLDTELELNLASWFEQDYPEFEILLGVRDADDPAAAVARRVAAAHPKVRARVIVDRHEVGENPKVNNLANLYPFACGDAVLIADSNVRVAPHLLADLVAKLESSNAGLVSAPIRGVGAATLGASLEALQLNTFVMGGVCAAHRVADRVCVVGKAMMVRRAALAAIGGFTRLSGYLAEDQVCGEDVAAAGYRVVVSSTPVDNVIGPIRVREFIARHLRWARIRSRMNPLAYCGEVLLHPAPLALAAAMSARTTETALLALLAAAAEVALAAWAERSLGVRRAPFLYPALVLLRDVLVLSVWAVPFFSRAVTWRGNTFRIGARTRLEPVIGRAGDLPDTLVSSPA